MPLPRARVVRLVATADDSAWLQQLERALEGLQEAVIVDSKEDLPAAKPLAAVLVFSANTSASLAVHRELTEWDRRRVPLHIVATGDVPVLGYLQEMATSVHQFADETALVPWLRKEVLQVEDAVAAPNHEVAGVPQTYFDAAAAYADALEARVGQIDVVGHDEPLKLDDVYVPLRLSRSGLQGDDGEALLDLLGGLTAQLFVIGSPGAGKSTLLDHTALQLARRTRPEGVAHIPLLLRASELVSSGYNSITDYAQRIVKGCVPKVGRQVSEIIFASEEFGDNRTYVFIDGVDELKREHRNRLRQLIRVYQTEFPESRIVVSSRPSGADRTLWEGFGFHQVLPLENLSTHAYVRKFASERNRDRLLSLLSTSERLRELAQVPFMLALMCSYDGIEDDLEIRRAGLIQACVGALLRRRPLDPELGFDHEALEGCLTSVAERLYRLDSSGSHTDAEFTFAIQAHLAEHPPVRMSRTSIAIGDQADAILEELLEKTGLLQRDGEFIDFVHRSIWEYFAGASLVGRSLGQIDDVVGSSAWEEPIRLMIGLSTEESVRAIVRRMWHRNPALALRSASECTFSLQDLLQVLLNELPSGEVAALVRDLSAAPDAAAARAHERLVLDTLSVLLPETNSCEVLWEGLRLLVEVRHRTEEAFGILDGVFCFERVQSRRADLDAALGAYGFADVPAGSFEMGSSSNSRTEEEKPAHDVQLSEFRIGTTPVTNALRSLFPFEFGMDDQRSPSNAHPVIGVTWYEAMVFAIWFGCRLPTEAEWEYAARAGGSDDRILLDESRIPDYAWYAGNADNRTHPVATRRANSFGLYDMLGNVREWCWDWYSDSYYQECHKVGVVVDPMGADVGSTKVLRGGCFDWNAFNLVPTYKNSNLPNHKAFQNGVRLVAGLPSWMINYVKSARDSEFEEPRLRKRDE